MDEKKKYRIGLGVTGGIAAYKAIEILRGLQKAGCEVRVAMTDHACRFIQPLTFRALTDNYVLVDDYAPDNPDPIAHINFSQSIDLLLIAPATANILAKFANGIADDFLSSTYLASNAPVLVAPAMNTTMWFQAATQRNIEKLKADGVFFVEPVSGRLACETVGTGKLEDVETIVAQALKILSNGKPPRRGEAEKADYPQINSERHGTKNLNPKSEIRNPTSQDLLEERILITTGGTREEIDPVRFISNHSSGKMGFALAQAAQARGAKVTVVAAATSVEGPENIKLIRAISADEMHRAVMREIENATVYIGAAAVADYRPAKRADKKIKKTKGSLTLILEKTTDILADVSKKRHEKLIVVGFAAETNDVLNQARSKLERKNLDLIVANDVSDPNTGFGSNNNAALVLSKDSKKPVELSVMSKREMADKILDEVLKLRQRAKAERKK